MKKIFIVSALCGVLACMPFMQSCSEVLDVKNESGLSNEAAITDASSVRKVMVGAYNRMQEVLGRANPSLFAETFAGDVGYTGSDFGYREMWTQNMSLFTGLPGATWQNSYEAINTANNVLAAIEKLSDMDDKEKDRIRGECYFLRGALHFEMLRMWGHQPGVGANKTQYGVVIRTEPTIGVSASIKQRSTVTECYDFVIDELKKAETLLAANPQTEQGRATSAIATAYLARVYFQKNDHANAYAAADKLVKSGAYQLQSNVFDVQRKPFTKEAVFQIPITTANNTSNSLTGMYRKFGTSLPQFVLSNDFVAFAATFPSTDKRQAFLKPDASGNYTVKFDTTIMNINVIRYAEILFIHAESGLETGVSEASVRADINQIRQRAGIPDLDASVSGKPALLAAIDNERHMEMAFEGDRLWYMKRTKASSIRGLPWDSDQMLAKIPSSEISGNPGIIPNP
ncbi:MAG: hypothetical protein RL156_1507 [Bacteroidota bacterium]